MNVSPMFHQCLTTVSPVFYLCCIKVITATQAYGGLVCVDICIYIWSNMLYLKIFIKICGIFKILILLPFFKKSFIWAAKWPKPLPIHWRVMEWGIFFKLSCFGCVPNTQSCVFFQTFQNTAFFVALFLSLWKSYSNGLYMWGDRGYPAVRSEYKTDSEQYLVAEI